MHQVESDIRSRLLSVRLPVMPQILTRLIEKCQADDAGMNVLADLIAKDPGITSKILAVAGSSAYPRKDRPISLEQSLAILGTDMIKTLVISESIFQVFNNLTHTNGSDLRSFWKHSLTVAILAKEIASKTPYQNIEEAYLAGLMHDVGRLALLSAATKEYAFIFFALDDDRLCAIEQNLLNLTHTEAGALLADRWNLDSFLSDSLLFHHQPVAGLENAHPLVRIVVLAHMLSMHHVNETTIQAANVLCSLSPQDIEKIQQTSEVKVVKCAELLGIDLHGADDLIVSTDGWEIAGRFASLEESRTGSTAQSLPAPQEPLLPQDSARKHLAEEVQNLVLSSELRQSFSRPTQAQTELTETIARSARILFDFSDVIVLRMDTQGTALVGVPVGEHRQRMSGFSVHLGSHSRLAEAAKQQRIMFLEQTEALANIDEAQLIRLLANDALICLPIFAHNVCAGMLIGAIAAWQIPELKNRERFLRSFSEQAATHLQEVGLNKTRPASPVENVVTGQNEASRRVAHEANNALSIIKNYLGVLDSKFEKKQIATREIAILHEEVDRVGKIIKSLSDPATHSNTTITEVNQAIRNAVQLFHDTPQAAARVIAQPSDQPCEVTCSPENLKQILINLIKNAIEAMPQAGEVHVIHNGQLNRDGRLYTELCIRDNGPGIPTEILASLFSPVKSTKGGVHQGLGLSIVHGLVKQSQGVISCRSHINKGTTFEILLPMHQRPSKEPTKGLAK